MLQVFTYNGTDITFDKGADVMVNLTEMAKPFGKLPADFLRLEQTKRFVDVLEQKSSMGNPIVTVNVGGSNPGTWANQKVGLKFAAWLNADLEVWMFDRITELLHHGATAINPENLLDPDYVIRVMTALKEERAKSADLANMLEAQTQQIGLQEATIKQQAPKVDYYNNVLNAQNLIATGVIAAELGISAQTLNKKLHARGIIYKVGNTWVISSAHREKGLAKTKTHPYIGEDGKTYTSEHLYWTQRGREFINHIFQNQTVEQS